MRTMLAITAIVSGVVAMPVAAQQNDAPRIMRPRPAPVLTPAPTPAPSSDDAASDGDQPVVSNRRLLRRPISGTILAPIDGQPATQPAEAPAQQPVVLRRRPVITPTTTDADASSSELPPPASARRARRDLPMTGPVRLSPEVLRRMRDGAVQPSDAAPAESAPSADAVAPATTGGRRRVAPVLTEPTPGPISPELRRRLREPVAEAVAAPVDAPAAPVAVGGAEASGRTGRRRDGFGGATGAVGPVQPGTTEIVTGGITLSDPAILIPPAGLSGGTVAGAVTLKQGSFQQMIGTMPVMRTLNAAQMRANPIITVGKTRVDFTPMLKSPMALPNIASRLRAMPDLVDVKFETLEAKEIIQGLIIRSMLTYRLRPGACSAAGNDRRLQQAGVNCLKRKSQAEQMAEFANPDSPHYVADPGARASALASFKQQSDASIADIETSLAAFRAGLSDPQQRSQGEVALGAAAIQRMGTLSDDELANEIANSGETKAEQVAFVPGAALQTFTSTRIGPNQDYIDKLAAADAFNKPFEGVAEIPLDTKIFLTGFTLGREHEWKQRFDTSISWCVFGCTRHYYAEIGAKFALGFGLRFPLKFGGSVVMDTSAAVPAQLKPVFEPFNGAEADYAKAGLDPSKIFEGKEFVAEIAVTGFASAKLPLIGQLGPLSVPLGIDFTDYLEGFLNDGQFAPPAPGQSSPVARQVLEFDLLGERANFGLVAARVFPTVAISLESERMSLALSDANGVKTVIERTTAAPNLPATIALPFDPTSQASNFTVSDPLYNVGFVITPGINPRLSINLGVWNHNWDLPIDFPQLSIKLPPDGMNFDCHDGTACNHAFNISPQGNVAPYETAWRKWGIEFDALWLPKCHDEICTNSVKLLRFDTVGIAIDKSASGTLTVIQGNAMKMQASKSAQIMVDKSLARKSVEYANRASKAQVAAYSPQCKDAACVDAVEALGNQMDERAKVVAAENPSRLPAWVALKVAGEFVPQFKQAVKDSETRVAMNAAREQSKLIEGQIGKRPPLRRN